MENNFTDHKCSIKIGSYHFREDCKERVKFDKFVSFCNHHLKIVENENFSLYCEEEELEEPCGCSYGDLSDCPTAIAEIDKERWELELLKNAMIHILYEDDICLLGRKYPKFPLIMKYMFDNDIPLTDHKFPMMWVLDMYGVDTYKKESV